MLGSHSTQPQRAAATSPTLGGCKALQCERTTAFSMLEQCLLACLMTGQATACISQSQGLSWDFSAVTRMGLSLQARGESCCPQPMKWGEWPGCWNEDDALRAILRPSRVLLGGTSCRLGSIWPCPTNLHWDRTRRGTVELRRPWMSQSVLSCRTGYRLTRSSEHNLIWGPARPARPPGLPDHAGRYAAA